jgi:hypothetical protein
MVKCHFKKRIILMKKISSWIHISNSSCRITDAYGDDAELLLPVSAAAEVELVLADSAGDDGKLRTSDASLFTAGAAQCYFAVDSDFDGTTRPLLFCCSNVSVKRRENGDAVFSIGIPNTGTDGIRDALGNNEKIVLYAEIGALNALGETIYAYNFEITLCNRIYQGIMPENFSGENPSCTTAAVHAIVNGAVTAGIPYIENAPNHIQEFGRIYFFAPEEKELSFTFDDGGNGSSTAPNFRIYIATPEAEDENSSDTLCILWPENILWPEGNAPVFDKPQHLYMIAFEWCNPLKKWLANQMWEPAAL